jgi:deoxyribodipyrimidine photo-lyase
VSPAVILFTRDLRVHDQPALCAARSGPVAPLFVVDPGLLSGMHRSPNRAVFLAAALADLDRALRELGGGLIVRTGDPVRETVRLAERAGATEIHVSEDVGAYAGRRERRLRLACREAGLALHLHPGVTVVPPGSLRPAAGDHFRVFTPYWRRWSQAPRRDLAPVPRGLRLPDMVQPGPLPLASHLVPGPTSPRLPAGGEKAGRRLLDRWLRTSLAGYGEGQDDLAGDATSRLSPYLHLGCLSPLEVAARVHGRPGAEPFLRQLCWRDFFHQVAAAHPRLARVDYRPRGARWLVDDAAYHAWQEGRTGYPIIDAGMRQLLEEGWMHNRARLLVASFLVKDLGLDWRQGAAHFFEWLVDGDLANNAGNWQWVAGTGNDTRPNRVFNPIRQALRFDPRGDYVRRHVPELRAIEGPAVHQPWKLPAEVRQRLAYPARLIDRDAPVR